jgi:hypothetical protein
MYKGFEPEYGCLLCGEYVFPDAPTGALLARTIPAPEARRRRRRPRKSTVAA